MTKKLFVPDHVARAMANKGATSELPRSLENAFGIKPPEESKNEQNPVKTTTKKVIHLLS
jgi:hypothetical protein